MIQKIEYDMESKFHTGNTERVYQEMGFHSYPDPLYCGVNTEIITNVSFSMLCMLHNSMKDFLYSKILITIYEEVSNG